MTFDKTKDLNGNPQPINLKDLTQEQQEKIDEKINKEKPQQQQPKQRPQYKPKEPQQPNKTYILTYVIEQAKGNIVVVAPNAIQALNKFSNHFYQAYKSEEIDWTELHISLVEATVL